MAALGPLSFALPGALLALVLLPALWWLLRVIPPAPRRLRFPPIRLIAKLVTREESAERTPPWLLALRLLLAAMLIVAAAGPLWNAAPRLPGTGPVVLIVDDGWAAARHWQERRDLLGQLLERADREHRDILLATTAPRAQDEEEPLRIVSAAEARERVNALAPRPVPTQREGAVTAIHTALETQNLPPGAVYWLTDGLRTAAGGTPAATLAETLRPFGTVTMAVPEAADLPILLREPETADGSLVVRAERADAGAGDVTVQVLGFDEDGIALLREPVTFAAGETTAQRALPLKTELLNRIVRLAVETQNTAGSVVLLDERWRRRPVGIVTEGPGGLPLLSKTFYLKRALEPFTTIRTGSVTELLDRGELAVLVLPDGTVPEGRLRQRVADWVKSGGLLLRFAGPRLAASAGAADPLLPVTLRAGERSLGGALDWRKPARLAAFADTSPFAGLPIPDDVEVRRQVLAEPSLDLDARTWARLDDGTPLVTAAQDGDGWLVLVHTSANAEWSSLALSGLYVEMLDRLVELSHGVVSRPGGPPLPPLATLDGYGVLGAPPPDALPLPADASAAPPVGPAHPPGLYGRGAERRALNLAGAVPGLAPLRVPATADVERRGYEAAREQDLRPWLLTAALVLVLLDFAVSLVLRGLLPLPGRMRGAAAGLLLAAVLSGPAAAQTVVSDGTAPEATLQMQLAYVVTNNSDVDAVSEAGLLGLSSVINRRTSVEVDVPRGVVLDSDELSFYPLIYWPVVAGQPPLSTAAVENVRRYMSRGGTILFDTRDAGTGRRPAGVRDLARTLEIPPLVAVPSDHVLGRSYYLLDSFPGRWTGGTVWVERSAHRFLDGVSTVVAGGNDWAAAWAVDRRGRPLYPVVPGGERQREMAYRFGINLVMYVLTGNYKADQVHLPAIMERLSQ